MYIKSWIHKQPHCILNVFCTNVALNRIESHSARIDCPCFCQFEFQQSTAPDSLEELDHFSRAYAYALIL